MEIKSLDEVKKLMKKYKEIWVTIPYYPNYQVSNYGRVKSNTKIKKGALMVQQVNGSGYSEVYLTNDEGSKFVRVHQLVAKLFFLPNFCNINDCKVNHIDENKSNNVVIINKKGEIVYSNLEWVSSKENSNWGTRNERLKESKKRNKNRRILQYKDGILIGEWNSIRQICNKFDGYKYNTIYNHLCGNIPTCYGFVFKYAE